MPRHVVFAGLAGLVAVLLAACDDPPRAYGSRITATDALTVDAVVRESDDLRGHTITVESRVESVCEVAGCWAYLQDGSERLYVSFATFTLPTAAAGRRCRVEGELVMRDDRLTVLATGLELLDG